MTPSVWESSFDSFENNPSRNNWQQKQASGQVLSGRWTIRLDVLGRKEIVGKLLQVVDRLDILGKLHIVGGGDGDGDGDGDV